MEEKDKKKEELEEKLKTEKRQNWFQRVPVVYKIAGAAILFVKYISLVKADKPLNELWVWAIAVVMILYFMGSEGKIREANPLTPEEAETELKKEIVRKIKEGQIPKWSKIYIGPNNGLFHHEGMPVHYQIGIEIVSDEGREHKRGIVIADGNTKGYATIQDSLGKLTGRESIPVISPLPNWMKRGKEQGLDIDRYIFGGIGK